MARITVEDCLDNVENRFELVMLATKRARQLATGGKDPLIKEDSDKATVLALREIAEGLISNEIFESRPAEEEEETGMDAFDEETEESLLAQTEQEEALSGQEQTDTESDAESEQDA